uniref:Uncharacterized protein n=1 Tax=Oncorhynchus tshawytscha TaxID=74940 RepID=A0A8C8FLE0_ONCTS
GFMSVISIILLQGLSPRPKYRLTNLSPFHSQSVMFPRSISVWPITKQNEIIYKHILSLSEAFLYSKNSSCLNEIYDIFLKCALLFALF